MKKLFGFGKKKGSDGGPSLMTESAEPLFPSQQAGPASSASGPTDAPQHQASAQAEAPLMPMLDDAEFDDRLEQAVNGSMDYLANEGLQEPGLFATPPNYDMVDMGMSQVLDGEEIDFVAANNAPFTCEMLLRCISERRRPLFDRELLGPLTDALRAGRKDPPGREREKAAALLVEAIRTGQLHPTFLNVLGLLHLISQNAASNGASAEVLAAALAPHVADTRAAPAPQGSRERRFLMAQVPPCPSPPEPAAGRRWRRAARCAGEGGRCERGRGGGAGGGGHGGVRGVHLPDVSPGRPGRGRRRGRGRGHAGNPAAPRPPSRFRPPPSPLPPVLTGHVSSPLPY